MEKRRFGPKWTKYFVEKDVEFVSRDARVVIDMSGGRLELYYNEDPRLDVLAIIGPGETSGQKFEKALLCEVGIGRARPYHEGVKMRVEARVGEPKSYPERRKWFYLTPDQYQRVAPTVFLYLQQLVNDVVAKWRSGTPDNPFILQTSRTIFYQGSHVHEFSNHRPWPRGCRFSVSEEDDLLIRDLYWRELNSDSTRYQLKGLIRMADKMFKKYRENGHVRPFEELKWVKEFEKILRRKIDKPMASLAPYLFPEILNYLPRGKSNSLYDKIACLIQKVTKWDGEETPQKKMTANALPNPESRIGNKISLRITSELRKNSQSADFVVFEVMPTEAKLAHSDSLNPSELVESIS